MSQKIIKKMRRTSVKGSIVQLQIGESETFSSKDFSIEVARTTASRIGKLYNRSYQVSKLDESKFSISRTI